MATKRYRRSQFDDDTYKYMVEIVGSHGVRYRYQNTITDARAIAFDYVYYEDDVGCIIHCGGKEVGRVVFEHVYIDDGGFILYKDLNSRSKYSISYLRKDGTLGGKVY